MTEVKSEQSGVSRRALFSATAAIGAGLVLSEVAASSADAAFFFDHP